jgi:ribosomal protein S18 acetylase RimI-like enzyme
VAAFDIGSIRIRRASRSDRDAILALVPRLVAFGPPAWRDPKAMSVTDRKVIEAALQSESEDPIVLAAVLGGSIVAGFLHLHSEIDYYRETKNGHVADLVVAEAYQGKGIARQLLCQAEDWARAQGFDWLTISVFRENVRAARTYERLGFKEDRVRLLKPLR